MSTQPERIAAVELFKEIRKQTKAEDTACAILVAIESMSELKHKAVQFLSIERLMHEICLGIRYGLFGTGASSNESIHSVAGPLEEIARAIRDRTTE